MCGRIAITLPVDAMAQLFTAAPANDLPEVPDYNLCPTRPVAVVTSTQGQRHLRAMRWGFIPQWYKTPTDGPLLINARAETIAEKPAFREACRLRRCVLPVAGFYEWQRPDPKTRLPWWITRADGGVMYFGAIWQEWCAPDAQERMVTCAIVTTEATAQTGQMAQIHNRVPVILDPADVALWLGEAGKGAARLMRAPHADVLAMHRVAQTVNSNRAAGPDLIAPIPD